MSMYRAGRWSILCLLTACAPSNTSESGVQSRVVSDVVYGHKLGMALTLDVFRPASPNGGGVIFLNSGGYVSPAITLVTTDSTGVRVRTDAEMADELEFSVGRLVDAGYTVFNVRHGSSPKFLLPEILDDVRSAVRFVRANASSYGVDSTRIGVWGGSAGGHLALMLGTTSEIGPTTSKDAGPAPVAAVVAYYPPSEWVSGRASAEEWAQREVHEHLVTIFPAIDYPVALDPELSPSNYATPDDAPTLIVHGDADPLVPLAQGEIMHKALVGAGVATDLVVIKGAEHGFAGADAELALRRTIAWFDKYLK